ncbi:MAG: hypothetical protein NTX50_00120 [Candidatus Sumerlaeota bacterium]|nr:hypothetical protein [Candidatus Sumerlaeota bacterium]
MEHEPLIKWPDVEAAIEDAERAYIGQPVEYARVMRDDGRLVFPDKKGSRLEVVFFREEQRLMNNAILFHNHPSGKGFSGEDLALAISTNLQKLIVSGRNSLGQSYRHVVIRPSSGWSEDPIDQIRFAQKVLVDFRTESRKVKEAFYEDIYYKRVSEQAFVAIWDHEAVKRLAVKHGFEYHRKRLY